MAGVAIGTWLLIFVLSASNGFESEVKNQLIGKDAHLEITFPQYEPLRSGDSLLKAVKSFPDIKSATPFIMSQAVFTRHKRFAGGVVFGIDPLSSQEVISLHKSLVSGDYNFDPLYDTLGQKIDKVIMGYALAARLGLMVGDKCILYVFTELNGFGGSFTPKARLFQLAGTFKSGMYQFDETLSYMSLEAAQRAFSMPGKITGVQAQVYNPLESDKIAKNIQTALGFPYTALDWQEKNYNLIKWMEYEKVLMGLALGIIIIIAAFNIISSLIMNVSDKKREIGILRAMGATRSQIARLFLYQGALIGIVGSVVGVFLGLLSCSIQMRYGLIQLPGDVYFVTTLPVIPKFWDVVAVVGITLMLCTIAGLVPAWQASRQNPVKAIRHD